MGKPVDRSKRQAAKKARPIHAMAQERAAEYLDGIPDGFVAIDRQLRYTYVNCAAERNIGRRREQVLGRTISEVYPQVSGTQSRPVAAGVAEPDPQRHRCNERGGVAAAATAD